MTQGALGKRIIAFAIPLALTGMLEQLFNAADTLVVGRFASKYAMAAVGSNSPIIQLIINLFVGIALGANVVIARYTGQGDKEAVSRGIHTAVAVSFLFGLLATGVGEAVAIPMLRAMDVPASVLPMSALYLRIYLAGMPVILLYNFESAIFRSQGNSRTPLVCLLIGGILNVLLNLLFVIVFHMDAGGVALATVISNLVSSLLLFILLIRSKGSMHLSIKKLQIDREILKKMMQVGVPSGVQGMLFSLANIIIQSAVNSLGADAMAASSAALNIEIFVYFLVNGFAQAATTIISQNYGAGKMDRCRKTFWVALGQDLLLTAVASAVICLTAPTLIGFFNSDPAVISFGATRLRWIVGCETTNVFLEILSGTMRGYGKSTTPALMSLIGVCGLRIAYVYTYFRVHHTFGTLMAIYPISWGTTALLLAVAYVLLLRKMRRNGSVQNVNRPENSAT